LARAVFQEKAGGDLCARERDGTDRLRGRRKTGQRRGQCRPGMGNSLAKKAARVVVGGYCRVTLYSGSLSCGRSMYVSLRDVALKGSGDEQQRDENASAHRQACAAGIMAAAGKSVCRYLQEESPIDAQIP
jgi:hypothetical protein